MSPSLFLLSLDLVNRSGFLLVTNGRTLLESKYKDLNCCIALHHLVTGLNWIILICWLLKMYLDASYCWSCIEVSVGEMHTPQWPDIVCGLQFPGCYPHSSFKSSATDLCCSTGHCSCLNKSMYDEPKRHHLSCETKRITIFHYLLLHTEINASILWRDAVNYYKWVW